MKYFSITSVEGAYHQISATTKEKFWGILGILHSIGETVYPNKYYSVETWRLSQYFEDLFRLSNKKKYSGTDEYSFVFSTKWVDVLSQDYLEGRPDIRPILVWAYRNHSFDSELSVAKLFETFLNDYHISKESAESLFNISFSDVLDFEDSPYSDSDLLLRLGGENDSEKATLKLGNSFVVANPGDLSRGPYFQPLYAALQTLKCLTIYPFNIHDYYNPEDIDILKVDNRIDDEPLQQIFYGAPGTGKSHIIKEKTKGKSVIRTTFHPDSDYSTFVGCYKPTMRVIEDNLSIVELTAKLKEMAMSGSTSSYPCQKFSARYWKSLKKLSPKEREDIIVACGFGKSFMAEVNKGMAIGEELAEFISDDRIVYGFVKQAFLKAYLLAWKKYLDSVIAASTGSSSATPIERINPNITPEHNTETKETHIDPVFLVIEEINRGNCAQIFGDLFQLLDRGGNDFSEYPIEADTDLQQEIARAFNEEKDYKLTGNIDVDEMVKDYTSNREGSTLSKDIQDGYVLLLPSNLYIWATMNTSDQSLFPIDSAFKRRWDWKYMKIANGKDKDGNLLEWKIVVKDKDMNIVKINDADSLPWWDFISKINEIIASITSSADKQLGYFFCKAKGGTIDEETFVSKVIFYLWNDVFKDYGFEDASLFQYNDEKGEPKDLTFPDFYDEEGKHVNTDRLKDFIENVMNWKKDKEESK